MGNEIHSEIVIALVCATGTSKKGVIEALQDGLSRFGYAHSVVKVSADILPSFADGAAYLPSDASSRIKTLMDAGDRARAIAEDASVLAQDVVRHIAKSRNSASVSGQPEPRERHAYIVDSLKRPEEVALLKSVYAEGLYLLGVFSSPDHRRKNLEYKAISNEQIEELMRRDEQGRQSLQTDDQIAERKFGQRTRDTFQLADFFVHEDHRDSVRNGINRFLSVIFGNPFETPSFDEYAMFMAFAASLRSADLGRQVGAVIARDNEILATGANDCPKAGGGLYWRKVDPVTGQAEDVPDGRDYTRGQDPNVRQRHELVDELVQRVLEEYGANWGDSDRLRELLLNSALRDLTEFGRSVHAEMEALLACARNGIVSRGATIYCTTFPCHNCARHIIAAGISRVVYVEPYPKSKALELHGDAISHDVGGVRPSESGKVSFQPYLGFGARRFFDLFSLQFGSGYPIDRKQPNGQPVGWIEASAKPRLQLLPHTYLDREELVATGRFRSAGVQTEETE